MHTVIHNLSLVITLNAVCLFVCLFGCALHGHLECFLLRNLVKKHLVVSGQTWIMKLSAEWRVAKHLAGVCLKQQKLSVFFCGSYPAFLDSFSVWSFTVSIEWQGSLRILLLICLFITKHSGNSNQHVSNGYCDWTSKQ